MLLSVDHGNYAIKTPFFSFVSGLSEHTSRPPLADELLEYEGRFWTLSGKRISYMRDKTQDDRFLFSRSLLLPENLFGQAQAPLFRRSISLSVSRQNTMAC